MSINYDELILKDRVHGSLYTDQAVFDEEMEKIFYRNWVYVGHESEVPKRGDYCLKQIGLQPVIMVQDDAGVFRIFFNRCTHLSNLMCHEEKGNCSTFVCPYHGWTFRNNGELFGVPFQKGYDESFEKNDHGLSEVACVSSYRGFIFAKLVHSGKSLEEYLGNAKRAFDQLCDLSPEGEIELSAGWLKVLTHANWKIIYENEVDGYHPKFVHKSIDSLKKWSLLEVDVASEQSGSIARDFGNGHTEIDFRPVYKKAQRNFMWVGGPKEEKLADYIETMKSKWGEEETNRRILEGPPHTLIYPNLFIAELFIMVIQPLSPNQSIQYQIPISWKGAPDLNLRVMRQTEGSIGSAGMILADDTAMYERNQKGMEAKSPEWLLRSRGMKREQQKPDGSIDSVITDDTPHRGIWKHYLELMKN